MPNVADSKKQIEIVTEFFGQKMCSNNKIFKGKKF